MTKRELIQAYVSGRIDRRDFMVRLTSLGVSGAAALAYAQSLTPSAEASSGRGPNGYITRTLNAEYGPGGIFQTIIELLQFAVRFIQQILNLIAALLRSIFADAPSHAMRLITPLKVGDALPNGDVLTQGDADLLKTVQNQLEAHLSAIKSAFGDFGAAVPATASNAEAASASGSDISALASALSDLVSFQAAVIPSLGGEGGKTAALRTTMTTAALVEAQHSAFVNQLAGDSPFPDTFAKASTSDDIKTISDSFGG